MFCCCGKGEEEPIPVQRRLNIHVSQRTNKAGKPPLGRHALVPSLSIYEIKSPAELQELDE